jgi:hypothetical protein
MESDQRVCAEDQLCGNDQDSVKVVRQTIKMSLTNGVDELERTIGLEGSIMQYLLTSWRIIS